MWTLCLRSLCSEELWPLGGSEERATRLVGISHPKRLSNLCVWFRNGSTKAVLFVRSNNKVTVNFINRDGEKISVKGSPGDSLLDIVINEDLDFDGFGV